MNFPTICIRCGLAHLPLWGRGQQGRNPETAETGSLRLEFPSGYSLSSETPDGSAPPDSSSSQPSPLWPSSLSPRPHLLQPGYKHAAHGCSGLSTGPRLPGEGATDLSSHMLMEPERGPLAFKAHAAISCLWHVGASFTQTPTHFRGGETDLKMAKVGQDQPDSGLDPAGHGGLRQSPGRSLRAASSPPIPIGTFPYWRDWKKHGQRPPWPQPIPLPVKACGGEGGRSTGVESWLWPQGDPRAQASPGGSS